MKTILKIIYCISLPFLGGGFIISFCFIILYNGVGDIFQYKEADLYHITGNSERLPARLIYTYQVNGKEYEGYQNVSEKTAEREDINQEFSVVYNTICPQISMISELKKRETKIWDEIVYMICFGIGFLFFFLNYKFTNWNK